METDMTIHLTDDKYVLDEHGNPQKEHDLLKWAQWLETAGQKRVVARTEVGKYYVSTVFLAMDYDLMGHGKPILYETMVFENEAKKEEIFGREMMAHHDLSGDEFFDRYSTREEAERGHERIVEEVKKKQGL